MKIVMPGGNGQVGHMLVRAFLRRGDECVVLTRGNDALPPRAWGLRQVHWDGRTQGLWAREIDGVDAVINLAGRSVDCRYSRRNFEEMMSSRLESTRAIGLAIAAAQRPPAVWLQASTATIYAHRFDAGNDETTGVMGGAESGVPAHWKKSADLARAWESELQAAPTPHTRKVILRSAMTMSPDRGGVFAVLDRLAGLGFGRLGHGRQFVSWIHEYDFVDAVRFLLEREELSGVFNLAAPTPLTNREFMGHLRAALGRGRGIPVPAWVLEIGSFFLRTETELVLKSRRVVPGRLLEHGFKFCYPEWGTAVKELVGRLKYNSRVTAQAAEPGRPA